MKKIDLTKFGPVVSDKEVGQTIYSLIKEAVKDNGTAEVELGSIKSMATFCAKQIFGNLYLELGASNFFEKILLKNANTDLRIIIKIGIEHALKDNGKDD